MNQETEHKTQSDDACGAARAGAADLRAESDKDAAPSNTASNNSNCGQIGFVPLRWGVDSLYLSYPGMLADSITRKLETLKKTAQADLESEQALAQYCVEDHVFEVKDKGSGIFPFVLRDNAFRIALSRPKSGSLPMAYVQVSSQMLSAFSPQRAEATLSKVLLRMGDIEPARTSRIDLYVDFMCDEDMEGWSRHAWVTRAHNIQSYSCLGEFSGWSVGMGGVMAARLYNKTLEIQTSGKDYLKELWLQAGWDGVRPIWRLEFEFKRDYLKERQLSSLESVLVNLNGLWRYATTEWLRLTEPNDQDKTRARWPTHPLWTALAAVDWDTSGGVLLKRFTNARMPDEKRLYSTVFSSLASYMAIHQLDDKHDGIAGLLGKMHDHFQGIAVHQGLEVDELLIQRIAARSRLFNSGINPQPEPQEPEDSEGVKAYRKASRGD